MMWYSSGTVSVENGSPSVVGVGTAFLSNVRVGDGMAIEGSLALHEVTNVASETGITISPAYEGASSSGMRFTVVPVLGYDKDLSDAFNRIRLEMGTKVQGLQPWAYASTVNEALGELGFQPFSIGMVQAETESEAQDALGMSSVGKSIATASSESSAQDALGMTTVGKAVATAPSENEARNTIGLPLATVEQMKTLVDTNPVSISPHLLRLAIHFSSDTSTLIYNHSSNTYDTSLLRTTSIHKAMRRCLVSDDGTINYYLDAYDSTKKEDGSLANLSGADGQVMVELKAFYCSRKVEGSIETISLSSTMQPGMVLHPAFFIDGKPISKILLGAYQATVMDGPTVIPGLNLDNNTSRVSLSTGKLCSLSGGNHYAMVGLDLSEFRALAKNRGPGWDEWDFMTWQAVQFLLFTQEGTFNGQQAIGDGNVHKNYVASSNNQSSSPHTVNGVSNTLGNQSGSMTGVNAFVTFNGLEHLWGNAWQWLDGCLISDMIVHVCDNPAMYSSTLTPNYLPIGSSIGANPSGSYILNCQNLEAPVFLNGSGAGNSSRYIGDVVWHAGGLRGARVGGGSTDGAQGGPAALRAHSAPASRYRSLGGRVMFKKLTST